MTVLLDTHAWLWWSADRGRLSDAAIDAIEAAETIGVAAVSCWELAMLVVRGRIELDREPRRWIRQALGQPGVLAIPLGPSAAFEAAMLPEDGFPGDPADRMIYATARERGAKLISKDRALRSFDPRGVLW